MTTTTAEGTTNVAVETTEGQTVVLEGEIVASTDGPATEDTEAPEAPAGEEKSSAAEVAQRATKEPEVSDLTEKEARKLADRIKRGLNGAADQLDRMNKTVEDSATLMAEAYSKRIWLALNEASWEDFVSAELGEVRVRLERGVRQSLAYRMAEEAHMSTRAIAPVFGVDQKTVSNDLRQVRKELGVESPAKVVGKDGKTYEDAPPAKPRKQKPVEERFAAVIEKADKFVGDLTALSVEDGFAEAAGAIAKLHRKDIARLIDGLKGVQDRLQ